MNPVTPGNLTYGNGRVITRAENRRRALLWAKHYPKRRKEIELKYRRTEKGKSARRKIRKAWGRANTAAESAQAARYRARIPDAYCLQKCRARGIINPTPEDIYHQRIRILAIRARRTLNILAYGSRIKN